MSKCRFNGGRKLDVRSSAFRRSGGKALSHCDNSSIAAFTLIELLVVIAIIGVLAAVALPKISSFGKSNATISATQQLLDDVAQARSRAIANRSDVYMVFVPPADTLPNNFVNNLPLDSRKLATNLLSGQYTTYALFSFRNVGDQPGAGTPRYLTAWKTLPQGTFVPLYKFKYRTPLPYTNGVRWFETNDFPYPLATNTARQILPYIGFDFQGRVFHYDPITRQRVYDDEVLPLARGSTFYDRDASGHIVAPFTADVQENPPNNSVISSNHIHIDWLTGRAHIERQQIQ